MSLFLTITTLLGGLALFLHGMGLMSAGLRDAAGPRLRTLLARGTRRSLSGLLVGTVIGGLIRSSAGTVMTVGLVNAGLLTLAASIPLIMGFNVGATLSMQLVAFKLTDYALLAVALGFACAQFVNNPRGKAMGHFLLGFGLLFLGLDLMGGAIKPYRDAIQPVLGHIDGVTWNGRLLGVGLSILVTSVIQSSGATIGMAFAMISAGAITSLQQALPIILGAHIGTCATALIGSVGTSGDARRCALAHLFFNLSNVALALLAWPLLLRAVQATSPDLLRQAANAHTMVMLVAALLLVGFTPVLVPPLRRFFRSAPIVQPSHLESDLLPTPEAALRAVVSELQRVSGVARGNLQLLTRILFKSDPSAARAMIRQEDVLDETKAAIARYIDDLSRYDLSRRQALLIQYLVACMDSIERIGDHLDALRQIAALRSQRPAAFVPKETKERFLSLVAIADKVLSAVEDAFNDEEESFASASHSILKSCARYTTASNELRAWFHGQMSDRHLTAAQGLYFRRYLNSLDRLISHARQIGETLDEEHFLLQFRKLEKQA